MNIKPNDSLLTEHGSNLLRPGYLNEFIGHEQIKKNLSVFIKSTKLRAAPLDHVILSGPPGLGKTTLSQIIANELNMDILATSGPVLEKQGDLAAILTKLTPMQVLFVDEIHRLNKHTEELLYSAMEDFKLDIKLGKGPGSRSIKIDLPPFTLVAATTRLGLLSAPLRDRFGIPLRLDFYEHSDLTEIIKRSASILDIKINHSAAEKLAERSRGTPRKANILLKRTYDYALVNNENEIKEKLIDFALKELAIDSQGLDLLDRKYLSLLRWHYKKNPIGLNTIACSLSEDKNAIELSIEPFLLRLGFINKTPRGRELTKLGYDYSSNLVK